MRKKQMNLVAPKALLGTRVILSFPYRLTYSVGLVTFQFVNG
jgi:hypothetical protein